MTGIDVYLFCELKRKNAGIMVILNDTLTCFKFSCVVACTALEPNSVSIPYLSLLTYHFVAYFPKMKGGLLDHQSVCAPPPQIT
jgi:hypothetical protein